MARGLARYATVLEEAPARRFVVAGLLARMPMSMSGLGIVLLISITTGSFGRAGLVAGCATVSAAAASPWWGRRIDRVGQAPVLRATSACYAAGVLGLVATVLTRLPVAVACAAAVLMGLGVQVAGSSVRARWSHRLRDTGYLDTAFALEAVIDEIVFIFGPVLATFLATTVHPALGLVAAVGLCLTGSLALAAQRSTEPPLHPRTGPTSDDVRISVGRLLPVTLGCFALGVVFGGMEVVVVAFATESGILRWAGALATAWALGSLLAGLVTGTRVWRAGPARRFRVGGVALALSTVPLVFVTNPIGVGGLLLLSGLAIAPTLIATVAVTQSAVPASRFTEALGWNTTGLAAGVAVGSATLGQVVDGWGSGGGFVGLVGAALLLILSALGVRAPRTSLEPVSAPGGSGPSF